MISYKRSSYGEYLKEQESGFLEKLIKDRKHIFGLSGRTIIYDIFAKLQIPVGSAVLVPEFYPEGIKLPLERMGNKIITYALNRDFSPSIASIEQLINTYEISVCFLIHYHGIYFDFNKVINIFEKKNVYLIEDCAQALFNYINRDYNNKSIILYSFPKFLSITDGALAVFNIELKDNIIKSNSVAIINNLFAIFSIFMHSLSLKLRKIRLRLKITLFSQIVNFLAIVFYVLYYKSLCMIKAPVPISKKTYKYLVHFDYKQFMILRERNYNSIAEALENKIQKSDNTLSQNYLGYIVRISPEKRDLILQYLKKYYIEFLTYKHGWYYSREYKLNNSDDLNKSFLIIPVNEHINPRLLNHLISKFSELLVAQNASITQI